MDQNSRYDIWEYHNQFDFIIFIYMKNILVESRFYLKRDIPFWENNLISLWNEWSHSLFNQIEMWILVSYLLWKYVQCLEFDKQKKLLDKLHVEPTKEKDLEVGISSKVEGSMLEDILFLLQQKNKLIKLLCQPILLKKTLNLIVKN